MNDPDADVAAYAMPEASADRLWQTHRMFAVGRLSGGIAHEFNNLTQRVIASLEVTRRLIVGGRVPEADTYIAKAIQSVQEVSSLNQRLARFVRPQAIVPSEVSLNAVIADVETVLRSALFRSFRLEIAPAAQLWTTYCDRGQAEVAILDMVLAARDSIPDGGTIAIATRNDGGFGADDGLQARSRPRHYVCVVVTAEAATVTGSFDRAVALAAPPPTRETGDELHMVDRFARTYGGELRHAVEAGERLGTALCLPRCAGAA
jgi:signal transduction histidine kinase